ncbi:TetR family transcriptional regulator [Kibdelosporangium philippinense]|uniref:TetR family transcriptional regulator n=1 Tax=Kibdelosporangium philippinense TaxID=211113 RepID=A0ABS8ZWX2_9PSEU|nr:TetR/AcrR family transcriptional regulator [Kibdelosporangium philippinense]MCE7011560.1 TetR family transcriptional regulator [Kibdelosporangium philippinense]
MSEQRKRDSAASKVALLDAARDLFADRGYDRTTVRDIAARAGVNQALLFRYFGSKEALFAAVVARSGKERLAEYPRDQVFARMLRGVLDKDQQGDHTVQIMLRSSGEDTVAKDINEQLGQDYVRALAGLTDQPDSALRAHLVLAWIIGIDVIRSIARADPLASAGADEVMACVLPAVRTLLEGVRDIPDA